MNSTRAKTKPIAVKRRARGVPWTDFVQEEFESGLLALLAMYDDPLRPGLIETPMRVARMYHELLTPQDFTFTMFDAEGADQMIVERDIPFSSLCEHHLLPFVGTATVAYIPSPEGKIAGLSKLARAVDHFAKRLQTQERLTNQVAAFLKEQLEPQGVGVVLHAEHFCMTIRGVQKPGTMTTTSALLGAFRDGETRSEFLALAYQGGRR